MSKDSIVGKVGKFNICFEEASLSSHAGMVLWHAFAETVGVTDILDEALKVKQRERGYGESELVMGLVNNVVVGGDCLLDLEVLRGDRGTQALLGVTDVLAPTTAGEFLRKFDIGDIHDLRRVNRRVQARSPAPPGDALHVGFGFEHLCASFDPQARLDQGLQWRSRVPSAVCVLGGSRRVGLQPFATRQYAHGEQGGLVSDRDAEVRAAGFAQKTARGQRFLQLERGAVLFAARDAFRDYRRPDRPVAESD